MNSKDREEIAKWLRLGYETYGSDGASAVADAMGVILGATPDSASERAGDTTTAANQGSTATLGSVILTSDEQPSSPDYRFRYGSVPQTKRPPRACPSAPPRGDLDWRSYVGDPSWFHCGFNGFLENRKPSSDWPVGECFYDKDGRLVDDAHPYAGCKGTADSYDADDWFGHTFMDEGGIARSGGPAFWESLRYFEDEKRRQQERFRRHRRRP